MEEKKVNSKVLEDGLSKQYIIDVVYHNNNKYGEYFSLKFTVGNDLFYLKLNDNDKRLFSYLLKQDIILD